MTSLRKPCDRAFRCAACVHLASARPDAAWPSPLALSCGTFLLVGGHCRGRYWVSGCERLKQATLDKMLRRGLHDPHHAVNRFCAGQEVIDRDNPRPVMAPAVIPNLEAPRAQSLSS